MWTSFMDMHSGGSQKEKWARIYIEAPEQEAMVIFYNRFGRSADHVTCKCCGSDYSTSEYKTLEDATNYHRNYSAMSQRCPDLEEYIKKEDVLVIHAEEILPSERLGELPREYGWW